MTVATNMIQENVIININDELHSLTELFKYNGWQIETPDGLSDKIIYSKLGNETEYFKMEQDGHYIYVSVLWCLFKKSINN